jgi:diguanylate cyclase (GGDEF)-like protein
MADTGASSQTPEGNHWLRFSVRVALVIAITGLVVSASILWTSTNLVEQSLYLRARAHFKDIVLTRRWNAGYGGVFVEKKTGVVSNPYLTNPDITDVDGKVYTKKNPALMTREISELAEKEGDFQFHITSLKLKNPNNQPDSWEAQSLARFESGVLETTIRELRDGHIYYRYMAPLMVEESCLQCHADQGYKVGDVRGGISVSFDITPIQDGLRRNQVVIVLLVLFAILLVLGIIFTFVRGLYKKLEAAQKQLQEMVIIDDLTRVYNRRYFFQAVEKEESRARRYGAAFSCIMMDVDHFKLVNDHFGHDGGDKVLKMIAGVLKSNCRKSDLVARFGGEEFMIILPQTRIEDARPAAEKLRQAVADAVIESPQGAIRVTASFGVAAIDLNEQDRAVDAMLERADQALYQAKAAGRNTVRG